MPAFDMPPVQPAAEVRSVATSQSQADAALAKLRERQYGTPFQGARPSAVPGLITVLLPDEKVAYTDLAGRYYIVGVVFDLTTGRALDGALDGHVTGN